MNRLAALVMLLGALAQGVFVSGILPVIQRAAPDHAASIYALYFAGLVAGQLAVIRFTRLGAHRLHYPAAEAVFGAAIALMASGWGGWAASLTLGRALEGLAAGISLPLGFATLIRVPGLGSTERRIALYNTLFALGFVAGPPAVSAWLEAGNGPTALLRGAGALFVAIAALLALTVPPAAPEDPETVDAPTDWLGSFYSIFLAKTFYGFFLPYMATTAIHQLRPLTIGQAMAGFSLVFVAGQVLGTLLVKRLPAEHLRAYVPLGLALVLPAVFLGAGPPWLVAAALAHSLLLFVGYLEAAAQPAGARAFARTNVLSDPGMLLGALLAGVGPMGMLPIAALALAPLVRAARRPAADVRAEALHPFVGPITMAKVVAKQQAPRETPRDWPAETLLHDTYLDPALPHDELTIAFAGDWGPTPAPLRVGDRLAALLATQDLRAVNLETPIADGPPSSGLLHRVPPGHLAPMLPAFDVVACVNNHVADAGAAGLARTRTAVAATGALAVGPELVVTEVHGTRVGFFARTFGHNLPWHGEGVSKPERAGDDAALFAAIARHRAAVDVLVMSYHWGYEAERWPSALQHGLWRRLQAAGVDVLWGHHGHLVQGFEAGPGLCLYSCGNLALELGHEAYAHGAVFTVGLARDPLGRWAIRRVERHATRFDGAGVELG